MILAYLGMATGMFLMWVWLTYGLPARTKIHILEARCAHCSKIFYTVSKELRTPNYCKDCK
jgi:hypothetical protein